VENLINWLEIPSTDFKKAVSFYKYILRLVIKETELFCAKTGLFPTNGKDLMGRIVQGENYKPSTDGIIAYPNGGNDLQNVLDKVENRNSKIFVPKNINQP